MSYVEVAIALVWKGGKLLVTRRPRGVHLEGFWEFPGGKLSGSETPEQCAEREVREEVGILVSARSRRPAIRHAYAEREVLLHPVDCDWQDGDVLLVGVDEARWVSPRDLSVLRFPEANLNLVQELASA
jgi:mutator protein MutT